MSVICNTCVPLCPAKRRKGKEAIDSFLLDSKISLFSSRAGSLGSSFFILQLLLLSHQISISVETIKLSLIYLKEEMMFQTDLCFRASKDIPLLPSLSAAPLLLCCSCCFLAAFSLARSRWLPPIKEKHKKVKRTF